MKMNGCLLRDIDYDHVENENGKRLRKPRMKKDAGIISTILDINQDEDETQDDVKIRVKKRKPRKKLEKIVYYVYCSPGPGPVNEIDDIIQKWMNYNDDDD